MTAAEKKAIVRRYFEELWNRGDTAVADEIIAPAFHCMGGAMNGREAVKLYISSYRAAFPKTRFTILSIVHHDNLVTVCWAGRGTHHEMYDACANRTAITGMTVFRIDGDKIAQSWIDPDHAGACSLSVTTPQLN